LDDSDDKVLNTQGKPMSTADEIRIVDDAGCDVSDGVIGHLLTRGPYTIRGYYGALPQNASAFTADGFYRSGDLVKRRVDGYLVVEGRDKDQINRGGEKVSALEVEGLLLTHPDVGEAAIVGVPDEYRGEVICAFVVLRDKSVSPANLRAFLKKQGLATFKIPDRFYFLEQFPTTGVGKISKKKLREDLKAQHFERPVFEAEVANKSDDTWGVK